MAMPGMGGGEPSQEVVDALMQDANEFEWVAAIPGATVAAS